jgi:D-alanine-D-alanine ligase
VNFTAPITTLHSVPASGHPLVLAVVFGGRSEEHEISLRSARAVIDSLDRARYDVRLAGVTRDGRWLGPEASARLLEGKSPLEAGTPPRLPAGTQCVFPVMHGPCGEDGTLQGWLELLGLPFVGSSCTGAALAMDKSLSKHVLRSAGVPVVAWTDVHAADWQQRPDAIVAEILRARGLPCFVKPARLGSSVGISKAKTEADLRAGLDEAFQHGEYALVEPAVSEPRELEVAVLDGEPPVISLPGEIRVKEGWYDYANKYENDSAETFVPAAELPAALADHLRELSLRAFRVLRLKGFARVDFLMDSKSGRFYLNEINAIPGFTNISMFPRLMQHAGLGLPELCDRLIALALRQRTAAPEPAPLIERTVSVAAGA